MPGNTLMTTDGLFITNDVLLQLNQNLATQETQKTPTEVEYITETVKNRTSNATTDLVINTDGSDIKINVPALNSNEIIHLLNVDGQLLNVSKENNKKVDASFKNVLKTKNGKLLDLDEYFKTVLVYKCIKCNYLCEERSEILKHISNMHLITIEKVNFNERPNSTH